MHQGIDFAALAGSPIFATAAGKVIHSGWESGYGNSIIIEHDSGIQTRYAHCAKLLVKTGARVSQGDIIAKVGSTGHSTGPHLHFEVIVNGERRNPSWYYPLEATQHIATK
jgi:murein DD-endopeptidase MepM/ murein hydrolase activator NlpD